MRTAAAAVQKRGSAVIMPFLRDNNVMAYRAGTTKGRRARVPMDVGLVQVAANVYANII